MTLSGGYNIHQTKEPSLRPGPETLSLCETARRPLPYNRPASGTGWTDPGILPASFAPLGADDGDSHATSQAGKSPGVFSSAWCR